MDLKENYVPWCSSNLGAKDTVLRMMYTTTSKHMPIVSLATGLNIKCQRKKKDIKSRKNAKMFKN